MRTMEINKRTVYYALYEGITDEVDEEGNYTGNKVPSYSDPIPLKINVSPARGEATSRQFGDLLEYDKTLVTTDMSLPIDEQTIMWIDNLDTTQPHDYKVTKVAKGLNSVQYAVAKVAVSK